MRKIILAAFFAVACSLQTQAQNCPTASFVITDSICGGDSVGLVNMTTGGTGPLSYSWDFCPGDLKLTPTFDSIADFGNFANVTFGIDLAYDNGNWYGFALNAGFQSITRYDFGNSLKNTPTAFDLGNVGGMMATETDIKVVQDNGLWYLFVCKFFGDIIRIELGASITNPTPVAIHLNNTPGPIANPFKMDLVKDHGSYKIITANAGNGSVSIVDIGTNIANDNPTVGNLVDPFAGIYGIKVVRDCDKWYGVAGSSNSTDVYMIDFGDSITTTAQSVTNLGVQGSMLPSYDIEIFHDDGKWYGFTLGSSTLMRINFGATLNVISPPVDNLGLAINTNVRNFSMKKSGSEYIAVATYEIFDAAPDLYRMVFPDNCGGNISTSTDTNPAGLSYINAGFQHVSLEATDSQGNFSSYVDSVFLKSAPATYFTYSPACIGSPVAFTDSSYIPSGTITSWSWDFGDSNTSVQQNPSHPYSSTGDYVVTLTATSSSGCSNTYTDTVSVRDLPVAAFSFTDSSCSQTPVLFTDLTTSSQDPVTAWSWDFGDSSTAFISSPFHTFQTGNTYLVSLISTTDHGCSSAYSDSIHIRPRPDALFDVANTCIGETVQFMNLSSISDGSPLTYDWDLDDSATSNLVSPAHSYPATVALYNVTLIAYSPNGCTDTAFSQIRIGNQPVPAFSFSPLTVCKGNSVSFTDLSTVPGGGIGDTINTWLWNFGDTLTSSLQNPVHAYSDTGTYTISLTVTSPTSCDSTVTQQVTVIDAPVAGFNYSDVCLGAQNTFTDFSTAPQGSVIISRSWDFGDSTNASGAVVSHTYSTPGTYNVTLLVTDTFGCTDFIMHQVNVYPVPVASFTTSIACTGTAVNFFNTSSISNGDSIVSYFWDLGDGNTSVLPNPSNNYAQPGSKTVVLVATSSHGCIDSISQLVFVHPSPVPNFTYSPTCKGEATAFTYIANPFPSTINNFNWAFGDLTTSNDSDPIHVYASATTYNVTVTVTDNAGCTASITIPVTVHPLPDANFSYSKGCENTATLFTDSSQVSNGVISTYSWNFGAGTSGLQSPSFTFDSAGTYNVSLLVTSDAGCKDSVSKPVTIVEQPEASFTMSGNTGSPPFSVTFTNTSTHATTWYWDFGDGFNSTSLSPVHQYTDSGIFTVMLVAFNDEGCSDTAYNSITVLIPYLDLAVYNVGTTRLNNLLYINADLFNLGNIVINNFEIVAQLEGGTIIHENYAKPMMPGLMKYVFNAKLETNEFTNPDYICVEVRNPNGSPDAVPWNDRKCTGTGGDFSIIDIYNNPSEGIATIHFNLPFSDEVTIRIYDVLGRMVSEEAVFKGAKGLNTYRYSTRPLTKGTYTCYMKFRDEAKIKKILKF